MLRGTVRVYTCQMRVPIELEWNKDGRLGYNFGSIFDLSPSHGLIARYIIFVRLQQS